MPEDTNPQPGETPGSPAPVAVGPESHTAPSPALSELVQALLLERSEAYSAPQMAVYIDGWTAALELMHKVELLAPQASSSERALFVTCVEAVKAAQEQLLADDDFPDS